MPPTIAGDTRWPIVYSNMNSMAARMMFMMTPAEITSIRAPTDAHRKRAVTDIVRQIEAIAKRRKLALQLDVTHENRTVPCAPWLQQQVAEAIAAEGYRVFELPSGAGHDGMAMIDIADVGMVFVRCRGGISHHPDEHVDLADADAGARVLLRLIENFRPRSGT